MVAEPDWSKLKVLVIEDEPYMRKLATEMVQDIGCQVFQAAEGGEALRLMQMSKSAFDVALCDLRMENGMDGFTFVEKVRQNADPKIRDTVILIMSGNSDLDSVERVLRSGIQGFLVKPVARGTIMEKMRLALENPSTLDP